jgi:hypothetical protein
MNRSKRRFLLEILKTNERIFKQQQKEKYLVLKKQLNNSQNMRPQELNKLRASFTYCVNRLKTN